MYFFGGRWAAEEGEGIAIYGNIKKQKPPWVLIILTRCGIRRIALSQCSLDVNLGWVVDTYGEHET